MRRRIKIGFIWGVIERIINISAGRFRKGGHAILDTKSAVAEIVREGDRERRPLIIIRFRVLKFS